MEHYFKSKGYVPGGVITNTKREILDLSALPPFLRVLLLTDGTVTKSLEAYFWEPIAVDSLAQDTVRVSADLDWIGLKRGDRALQREVRLIGAESGVVYAYAKSLLKLEMLPAAVQQDLLSGGIGIGELLRERGLETYREILDMGREADPSLARLFNDRHGNELLYRVYRVLMKREAIILIEEKFPYRLYAEQRPA